MATSDFIEKYTKIIAPVSNDLKNLESYFEKQFAVDDSKTNPIIPIIKEFLAYKGKRIRPVLMFLVTKALGCEVEGFHYKSALSIELIHNATLIHDDIIDCSLLRRGRNTLNFDYDSKLAVLAGDFLLAEVLKLMADVEDKEIRKLYSDSISWILKGELNQYFNRFKLLTIEEYAEKSKDKTARLFEAGIVSSVIYNKESSENIQKMRDFALNFGIGFQIFNDIENFNKEEKIHEDIENGDFTAPLIYYIQDKYGGDVKKLNNMKQALIQLKSTDALDKAGALAKYYITRAIENISFLEDNQYTRAIKNLCELYVSK